MKSYANLTVGVLALQGAVSEHCQQIEQLGAKSVMVKNPEDLTLCDGLVLPGGESTAMGKLMRKNGLFEVIKTFHAQGKGIFGTCAGMILLAKQLKDDPTVHLGLMDIEVQRNAFGRQIDSFQTDLMISGFSAPFPAVFIRAPYIVNFNGEKVESLAEFDGNTVLARQDNLLACAFHPELTANTAIMELFLGMLR
ncbi:glutamine amidotransferase subunit PdxT [Rodentibacter rarus]|uniref:Pyridoxal 5'-phosphate synthase subunit PdxT n=1 Tax=Rodentibacter rarus TaxID=1908260 RepID=A0A1V3INW2_9PAST|nr:pyridoxal 5'-phosphate synthase glutaminase subunit PdxT [Rodentibacter rarus]OOF38005.1 glutamine amidotransferase subunit PdxT [Rodentibacter rarus]OOF43918.1 glutamine amidotransferase subunit PdxT [Rodentibacter rarus]